MKLRNFYKIIKNNIKFRLINNQNYKIYNIKKSIIIILTCKLKILKIMDRNAESVDSNYTNSAIADDPSLPLHNHGIYTNPSCVWIPTEQYGYQRGERRQEESSILYENQTNFYAYNYNYYYTQQNSYINYNNYNNVSFNSGQGSSRTRNYKLIAREQQEIIDRIRQWVKISPENTTTGFYFTVLNYNVLAQDLIQENAYLYKNHHPRACLWETRWNNLYREITSYNADIICLQEVQESHLKNYYKKFEKIGYVGVYKKRTGMRPDGCAIYYKKSVFKMFENTTIEFNQGTNVLDRGNVAIIVKLAPKNNPTSEFIVATTHLLYNPKRMDVRLAQTQVLLAETERMAFKSGDFNRKYLPIIITGDFNSKPDSAVYKLIVNGTLKYDHLSNRTLIPLIEENTKNETGKILLSPQLKITDNCQHYELIKLRERGIKLTRSDELPFINLRHTKRKQQIDENFNVDSRFFSTGILTHPLNLLSAFKHVNNSDFEATTHQTEWITVDYIFYSGKYNNSNIIEDKLKLISNLRIPTVTELQQIKYIPNHVIGSDHLPLLSKFQLID